MSWLLLLLACQGSDEVQREESSPPVDSTDSDPVIEPQLGCSEERVGLGEDSCLSEAACVWTGERSREVFGVSLHIGPDVDGDGVQDMLSGSPGWYVFGDSSTNSSAGRVSLISGASLSGEGGLAAMHEGSELEEYLGSGAQIVGDVDGDGLGDMLVGAMGHSPLGLEAAGAAHLILGQDGGWEDGLFAPAATWEGPDAAGRAGWQVGGGDLDGDGLAELWVTDGIRDEDDGWDRGQVWLIPGGSVPTGNLEEVATGALVGAGSVDAMGQSIALGDFDGDGLSDSAFGGPYGASYKGRVWIWPGGSHPEGLVSMAQHDHHVSGEANNDVFGWKLAAGDLDGDGDDELIVGSPGYASTDEITGAAWVLHGPFDADETLSSSGDNARLLGESTGSLSGSAVAGLGDLDGDGLEDVGVGAPGYSSSTGKAYVVMGASVRGIDLGASDLELSGESTGSLAGWSVAPAGDVDADGYQDMLVGSPAYSSWGGRAYLVLGNSSLSGSRNLSTADAIFVGGTGNEAGASITGADINGDGYSDVMVGAPGQHSTAGGLAVFPGPMSGTLQLSTALGSRKGATAGDAAGYAMITPGDVNSDGYQDVLVGAPYEATGGEDAGAAYLLLGSGL